MIYPSQNHLLAKHGIMASFTIAKRITQSQLKKMVKQLNIDENSQEFKTHLNNQIIRDTQLAVYNNKIPGWITNEKLPRKVIPKDPTPNKPANKSTRNSKKKSALSEDKKTKLTLFATIIVRKILEQKSTTEEKCFLIHRIVSGLGLRDSDFKKFQNDNLMDDDDFDDEDDHDHDGDDDDDDDDDEY